MNSGKRSRRTNMTRTLLVAVMWAVVCLRSEGQTNCPAVARPAFSLSTTVREISVEPAKTLSLRGVAEHGDKKEGESQSGAGRPAESLALSNASSDAGLRLYRRLEQSGNLSLLEPVTPSGSGGIIDAIFEPEVIRMGKTSVSGSIITACKRKNPLCLLNPIFFNFSW